MANPSLGGLSLVGVQTIDEDLSKNVTALYMPTEGADETEVYDFGGDINTITVKGILANSTVSDTKAIVDAMKAKFAGEQTDTSVFFSDQTGTMTVMCAGFTAEWELPGVICHYTLKLIQGKAL